MYKKALINLTAVTFAMSIVFGTSLTALAADGDPLPKRNDETWKTDHEEHEYEGDVHTDSEDIAWSSVYAAGEGTKVDVKGGGEIRNESEYWRSVGAYNGGEITIEGNVTSPHSGAETYKNSSVTITGNVTSEGKGSNPTAVTADGENAKMNVTGDVTALGEGTAIEATRKSETEIDGNATGATGILTDGTAAVGVTGNVNYTTNGVVINNEYANNDEKGKIVIVGTLNNTAVSDGDAAFKVDVPGTSDEIISKLPEIVVYEITDDTNLVSVVTDDSEIYNDVEQYLRNNIKYIVKEDDDSVSYITSLCIDGQYSTGSLTDKEAVEQSETLMTMTLQSAARVAVQEGYEITGGENFTVTSLGNNEYEIRLLNNKGGITIKATFVGRNLVVSNDEVTHFEEPASEVETPAAPFIFAKFTVTGSTQGNLPDVLGAFEGEEASNVPVDFSAKVVKVPAGNLTAIEYKNAFIKTVKEAPQNGTVILETAMCSCLDKAMVDALASRPDVTVQIVFPAAKNSKDNLTVTIPAGYDVNSLVDANGYCGFMYLNSIL